MRHDEEVVCVRVTQARATLVAIRIHRSREFLQIFPVSFLSFQSSLMPFQSNAVAASVAFEPGDIKVLASASK